MVESPSTTCQHQKHVTEHSNLEFEYGVLRNLSESMVLKNHPPRPTIWFSVNLRL